jgi:hypothetical protein
MNRLIIITAVCLALGSQVYAQGDIWYPDAYWSTPQDHARFKLSERQTVDGVVKEFNGGADVATREYMYDQRLVGNPKYYGTVTREINTWLFTAVRTKDGQGQDRSTVSISATAYNKWNPRVPRTNVVISRAGFDIVFRNGPQPLHTHYTEKNYTGNLNDCSSPSDTLTISGFIIPNSVFEAMNEITIQGRPEGYYGCP